MATISPKYGIPEAQRVPNVDKPGGHVMFFTCEECGGWILPNELDCHHCGIHLYGYTRSVPVKWEFDDEDSGR